MSVGSASDPLLEPKTLPGRVLRMSILYFIVGLAGGLCWSNNGLLDISLRAAAFTLLGLIAWSVYYWVSRDPTINVLFAMPAGSLIASPVPLPIGFLAGLVVSLIFGILFGIFVSRNRFANKASIPPNRLMAEANTDGADSAKRSPQS